MSNSEANNRSISTESVSIVVAICAILISAASFYATYLQAQSAERQVRAMTLPLIRFEHSNFDSQLNERAISFTLTNAGVGPAIIKNVEFLVEDESFSNVRRYFAACCSSEFEAYQAFESELEQQEEVDILDGGMITRPLGDVVIPGQSRYTFLQLYRSDQYGQFWDKLDQERFGAQLRMCYCSLLDECYIYDTNGTVSETTFCPVL